MNIKKHLAAIACDKNMDVRSLRFPDCDVDPGKIKVVMISEVPPQNPADDFYSKSKEPDYLRSTLGLFGKAGIDVQSMRDILNLGIYITTAVKSPKTEYTVSTETIRVHLPLLQAEIELFPNLRCLMLMGDVAKKAVNLIAKSKLKRNVIPSGSTYKIRNNEFYWDAIRVFPSYIITGAIF